jgi:hypothetical protein
VSKPKIVPLRQPSAGGARLSDEALAAACATGEPDEVAPGGQPMPPAHPSWLGSAAVGLGYRFGGDL